MTNFDVLFKQNGKWTLLTISPEDIDKEKYDNIWVCFFAHNGWHFEVTGQKDEQGNVTTEGVYVNCYDGYDDHPTTTITRAGVRPHGSFTFDFD